MRKNFLFVALIVAATLSLTGCGKSKEEMKAEADKARTTALESRIAATLVDPQSAQFRNTKLSADSKFLCGEINGKNQMGGYVGFRPFAVSDNFEYIAGEYFFGLIATLVEPAKPDEGEIMTNIRTSGCFNA